MERKKGAKDIASHINTENHTASPSAEPPDMTLATRQQSNSNGNEISIPDASYNGCDVREMHGGQRMTVN
jgi:hypothetical protein